MATREGNPLDIHLSNSRTIGQSIKDSGQIDFVAIGDDDRYWDVIPNAAAMDFLKDVWPYMTMGQLCKMRKEMANQLKWSAYGYGLLVKVNGDARW